jgi:hypothetical protein
VADSVSHDITWIITLFLMGALGVLVIMNPSGFATAGGTIFGGFNQWAQTLTGSGYKKAT